MSGDGGHPLLRRFPGLPLARAALGAWPAPVRRLRVDLPGEVALFVKDEGRVNPVYGGNKVRKLELALAVATARGPGASVVTGGAAGSHHCLATSLHGRSMGLDVHVVLGPQPDTPHVRETLARTAAAATQVIPVAKARGLPSALARVGARLAHRRGPRPLLLPLGGSSPEGVLGSVGLGLELAEDVAAGHLPEPDQVFLAAGSGGNAAGLWLGLRLAGLATEVVAVRVGPRFLVNPPRLGRLAWGAAALLPESSVSMRFPPDGLRVEGGFAAPGYGTPSDAAARASGEAAAHDLRLERTYTGRAFAACLAAARGGRTGANVVFVNTANQVVADNAPPALPAELEALLHPPAGR
jgi:1-aminocyclopropane-1-carboxylate deaminase/D-cysteine desulfhydrase-like pyridoxal-dependent ACC family enzyme